MLSAAAAAAVFVFVNPGSVIDSQSVSWSAEKRERDDLLSLLSLPLVQFFSKGLFQSISFRDCDDGQRPSNPNKPSNTHM